MLKNIAYHGSSHHANLHISAPRGPSNYVELTVFPALSLLLDLQTQGFLISRHSSVSSISSGVDQVIMEHIPCTKPQLTSPEPCLEGT
jgi:hypothetical protein